MTALKAGVIGRAAVALGAGRQRTDDRVDPRVGFDAIAKTGARLDRGDVVLRVHAGSEAAADEAMAAVARAVHLA